MGWKNMLIRSQNKQNIFNLDTICGIGFSNYCTKCELFVAGAGREYTLGMYPSQEKAFEVLDMIENAVRMNEKVFHMPLEEEV